MLYHVKNWLSVKVKNKDNKKFELMLTRRAKAYNTSCSQITLVYLQPFRRNSLLILKVCGATEDRKKNNKSPYFGSSESFKVIDVDTTKKLVTRHLL